MSEAPKGTPNSSYLAKFLAGQPRRRLHHIARLAPGLPPGLNAANRVNASNLAVFLAAAAYRQKAW